MKYATIALFLGVISASEFDEELAETLKISISPAGQKAIEKEAKDVEIVAKKIQHSRPVRNLEASFKRWAHTKEIMAIHKIDAAFMASPEGKRLVAEWKDVGELLKKHLRHDKKTGTLHLSNQHVDDLGDELDDVADQLKSLDGSKWEKAYDAAWEKALKTKEFGSLHRRAVAFKHSVQGKMLKKELKELKMAVKKNLKVTDLPEDSSSDEEEDIEEVADLLKISITPAGEKEIEKEAKDVKMTLHKIKGTAVFRNLEMSIKKWFHSKEVQHIGAVEKRFLASPEGKKLVKEWHDFGAALKKHIKKTKTGIHIDNKALNGEINKEFDDVADHYDSLKGSKWDHQYAAAWKAAVHNPEAKVAHQKMLAFKHSPQGKMLKKEIVELKKSIKKNLKVTDLPKKLQDSDSSSEEEEDEFAFVAKKKAAAKKAAAKKDSSSSDEDLSVKKPVKKAKAKKVVKKAKDSSSDEELVAKKKAPVKKAKKADSSSDEDLSVKKPKKKPAKKPVKKDSSSDEEDFVAKKKAPAKKDDSSSEEDLSVKKPVKKAAKKPVKKDDSSSDEDLSVKKPVKKAAKKPVKKDDSSSDEDLSVKKPVKKAPVKKAAKKDDSSSDEDLSVKKPVKKAPAKKAAKKDDSSSSDEDLSVKKPVKKAPKKKVAKKAKKADSSSSDEELSVKKPKKKVAKKPVKKDDSSSDEEDFADIEELLKITISPAGKKAIEKEWTDVEHVWDRIDQSRPVRNVEASLKRWGNSKEMHDLEALDKKFLSTPRGKKMKMEIEDVFHQLDKSVYHNNQGLHIDNKDMDHLDDEITDVIDEMKAFKKSKWAHLYENQMKKTFSNKQAQSLHRRLVAFKNSNEGKALKKEMEDFKMALRKNVKVTDLPRYEEDNDDMYLF